MLDVLKISKKNRFLKYIIINFLKINIEVFEKPMFYEFLIKDYIDVDFFYNYKKKFPKTKWMEMQNVLKFYQSNHDLETFSEMRYLKIKFEEILNEKIKDNIFKKKTIGKFKIKNMWFTIQNKNEGHHSHNHPKSVLSGVYYVKIEKNSGGEIKIYFKDKILTKSPNVNDFFVFSSSLFHSVNPYEGEHDRIAIAWDAIYTI
jgi:hypothetical protein